jgi:hypothetical protein
MLIKLQLHFHSPKNIAVFACLPHGIGQSTENIHIENVAASATGAICFRLIQKHPYHSKCVENFSPKPHKRSE